MSYQESQRHIDEAEEALRAGDELRARAHFREAAELQRAFVDALPPERVQTRSVYGLSAAALFYKAGEMEEAERLAHHFLAQHWIEPRSAEKLRDLLALITSARVKYATSRAVG